MQRIRPAAFSLLLALVSTSCDQSGTPEATQTTITATPSAPPVATLPGESLQSATFRIMKVCYGRYGLDVKKQGGGFFVDVDPATTPERSRDEIWADCEAALNNAGLNNPPPNRTPDQLRSEYTRWETWKECLADQELDIGPLISVDEFLANDGAIWPAPGYDAATRGMTFDDLRQLDAVCPPAVPTTYTE